MIFYTYTYHNDIRKETSDSGRTETVQPYVWHDTGGGGEKVGSHQCPRLVRKAGGGRKISYPIDDF